MKTNALCFRPIGNERETTALTTRAIRALEKDDPGHYVHDKQGWRNATISYLFRTGRIFWDDDRALFWIKCPTEGWKVATFMMNIASKFDPANTGGDDITLLQIPERKL